MNILDVIKTDIQTGVAWVEKEAGVVLTEGEKIVDTGLQMGWDIAKPLVLAAAGQAEQDVVAELKAFISSIHIGQDLATIEASFLDHLGAAKPELLGVAQNLGSMLLQAFIALALKAL